MKLVGSLTELSIRKTLMDSVPFIFENIIIHEYLENAFGPLSSAYVLGHTPDQGEDFYSILVNGAVVVNFELSRVCPSTGVENVSITDVIRYRKDIRGRQSHLQLAIAMDLATKKCQVR